MMRIEVATFLEVKASHPGGFPYAGDPHPLRHYLVQLFGSTHLRFLHRITTSMTTPPWM